MPEASSSSPADLVLDRYRPLSPIGSGGSGSVWLARDERDGREIALKIVSREGKAGSRAEREVEAAARLRHRRCLRTLDFASDEDHVYIAYEHVAGKTLRQALRDGEMDDRKAIEACVQILEALEHAHGQGVVHRDVKPANVLLVEGADVDVRLVDFGLARFAEAETLTELGDIPGTLAYISPERLSGETATAAADVWGVGVVLWEALVGWHPFWAGSAVETARRIESGSPSLSALRPDLPDALLSAVERALASDPARRPEAGDLARELRLALEREAAHSGRIARAPRRTTYRVRTKRPDLARIGNALASAAVVAWITAQFPFYPAHSQLLLMTLAAGVSYARPRGGSLLTMSLLVLPLGNYSFGLAFFFVVAATVWAGMGRRNPYHVQLPVIGPVAAACGGLFLLPLAVMKIRGALRRGALVLVSYLLAVVVAGMEGRALPPTGIESPLGIGVEGSISPSAVAGALTHTITSRPALLASACILTLAAGLLPYARRYERWGGAVLGASLIAGTLLPFGAVHTAPVIAGAWLSAVVLTLLSLKARPRMAAAFEPPATRSATEPRRIAV